MYIEDTMLACKYKVAAIFKPKIPLLGKHFCSDIKKYDD